MVDEGRLAHIEKAIDRLETKVDIILERIPTFVTWGRLGAMVATFATLVVAILNVFM